MNNIVNNYNLTEKVSFTKTSIYHQICFGNKFSQLTNYLNSFDQTTFLTQDSGLSISREG